MSILGCIFVVRFAVEGGQKKKRGKKGEEEGEEGGEVGRDEKRGRKTPIKMNAYTTDDKQRA